MVLCRIAQRIKIQIDQGFSGSLTHRIIRGLNPTPILAVFICLLSCNDSEPSPVPLGTGNPNNNVQPVQPKLTITPRSANVWALEQNATFSATVKDSNEVVNWSISPALGSLTRTTGETSEYIPPSFVDMITRVTLTATLGHTTVISRSSIDVFPPIIPYCNSFTNPKLNETIVGYTDKISYSAGESVQVKISVPNEGAKYAMAVYREGALSKLKWFQTNLIGSSQAVTSNRPYATDLSWQTSQSITIPAHWTSGLYKIRLMNLQDNSCFQIVFVLKHNFMLSSSRAKLAVLASDYTWQAYNPWGGASFYICTAGNCDGKGTSPLITSKRPNSAVFIDRENYEHLSSGTLSILDWLENQNYDYDLITDTDLDTDPSILDGSKVLILDRHSEYWTSSMYDHLEKFLVQGNSLINWGGNQIYWKVVTKDSSIEVEKSLPYQHTLSNEAGGLWRDLNRSETRILGVKFTSTAQTKEYVPYTVRDASSWVLAGTDLRNGSKFGDGCSGWETDATDDKSPANLNLIARGINSASAANPQAGGEMVYHQHPGGGGVFSVGSLNFLACRYQPVISKIMRNVTEKFLAN
jgi:N,N-dimethylformamidase